MKVIAVETTELTLPAVVKLAKRGTIILTQGGKPLAAIKDLTGSDWESVSLAANPRFRRIVEDSRRSYREHGGFSLDEVRRELGLKKPARTRKQNR